MPEPVPAPSQPPRGLVPHVLPRSAAACLTAAAVWVVTSPLGGCSASDYRRSADEQVYPLLDTVSQRVTGRSRPFDAVERPVDTLRARLIASAAKGARETATLTGEDGAQIDATGLPGSGGETAAEAPTEPGGQDSEPQGPPPITLTLAEALDVAAESNRNFQSERERLYLAALSLTGEAHDFAVRYGGGGSAEVSGTDDDAANASLSDDLSASLNTESGGRVVASFFQSFFRSILSSDGWDVSSVLSLTITQPLLQGAGRRIARESLTQAERNLVYQMRDFERFRSELAVDIVADYWGIVQQIADLESTRKNYDSVKSDRERIEALVEAGRATVNDLGRARQDELSAENRIVDAVNRLETALDTFKITLGLPVEAHIALDPTELDKIRERGVNPVELEEKRAIQLALQRRLDFRTTCDQVADSVRDVMISEDNLSSSFDFSGAVEVPGKSGSSANLDWSQVEWRAGFDIDLALDKLFERNAYRSSLISLDSSIRSRELAEDRIAADIRSSLRNIRSNLASLEISEQAVALARTRVESTSELFEAGRVEAFDVLDAKTSLLNEELAYTDALVSYSLARLQLLLDLEGISLGDEGLRYDVDLPIPSGPQETVDALEAAAAEAHQ